MVALIPGDALKRPPCQMTENLGITILSRLPHHPLALAVMRRTSAPDSEEFSGVWAPIANHAQVLSPVGSLPNQPP